MEGYKNQMEGYKIACKQIPLKLNSNILGTTSKHVLYVGKNGWCKDICNMVYTLWTFLVLYSMTNCVYYYSHQTNDQAA